MPSIDVTCTGVFPDVIRLPKKDTRMGGNQLVDANMRCQELPGCSPRTNMNVRHKGTIAVGLYLS